VLGIFEIGSPELFAWAGFQLPFLIFASQVARITGMSHGVQLS
jgi:hypothetical protein